MNYGFFADTFEPGVTLQTPFLFKYLVCKSVTACRVTEMLIHKSDSIFNAKSGT